MKRPPAALGLRAHSGWAALVAVAGTRREVEVVDRRRVELGDPAIAGPKQPYHEAEGKPLDTARRIIERYAEEARRRAREVLDAVVVDLRSKGHTTVGCGLLLAANRALPDLESILASHALIHTADGELFRDAIAGAAQECGLALLRVKERELSDQVASVLRVAVQEQQRRIGQMGRALGPPWTQDQKLATLTAWLALVGRGEE